MRNKNFPVFSSVLKLKTLPVVTCTCNYEKIKFLEKTQVFPPKISTSYDGLPRKGLNGNARILVKKSPERKSTIAKLGSEVHDTKDISWMGVSVVD